MVKSLSKGVKDAIESHYTSLALDRIYSKIMTDINANTRANREV
jgi:hypothetical protein